MKNPIITLLTDFGTRDTFVGEMKGVILGICPRARLVDLTHEIPAQAVGTGAFLLKSSIDYFPKGTVHLAVVDPGVGSSRKAIAVKSRGRFFVGPDNGLFPAVLECWGIEEAVELTEKKYQLPNPSSTFHGRDIFASAAAHLAKGISFSRLGRKLGRWVQGQIPKPRKTKGGYVGEVLWIDGFGNLITNIQERHLTNRLLVKVGKKAIRCLTDHFSAVPAGKALALMGSSGYLEVSVNRGRADRKLKAGIGTKVVIE